MRIRPVAAADVPALVRLVNEATPELPVDAAELETWLSDTVNDVVFVLAEDVGRDLAAFAEVAAAPTDARNAWLDLRVPPRSLDDSTVTALLAWAEAAAQERQRAVLRVSAPSDSPLGVALLSHGYRPIYSFRMRIDLDGAPPEPVWPDGISVRTFEPGEERAVFTAVVSLCRPSYPGRPGAGWVRPLAVRRRWRRRALALLLASFGPFGERGTRVVGLGVDGENTTGAVRLYEKAAMRVEHRVDLHERRLA